MKKIILTPEINESIDFLAKASAAYYGSINAAQTYQPHFDRLTKAIVEEAETETAKI